MTALVEHRSFLKDALQRQRDRRKVVDPNYVYPKQVPLSHLPQPEAGPSRPSSAVASKANVINYVPEEETVRNDYTKWYGTSGKWGSNYVLGAGDEEICEEYPALKRLMYLKSSLVDSHSHTPLYLPLLNSADIQSGLGTQRFDVILVTPTSDWNETLNLPIRNLSADPGFVFLWVGKGSEGGLEKGRECFAKWGFRRAEDIVWVKTNKGGDATLRSTEGDGEDAPTETDEGGSKEIPRSDGLGGLFASQKEHCLMGIRGTVRRSTDNRFVHCNVDTDVMIWEDSGGASSSPPLLSHMLIAEPDAPRFPPYLQTLIENFCLGTRRLHIFGNPTTARRGWVTAGLSPLPQSTADTSSDQEVPLLYDPSTYTSQIFHSEDGRPTLPFHPEIDTIRPKSPARKGRPLPGGSGGGGAGGPSRTNTPNAGVGGGGRSGPRMQGHQQAQGQVQGHYQQPWNAPMNVPLNVQAQMQAQMMAQMHMQAMQMQMQGGMMFHPSIMGPMGPMGGMQGMGGMGGMGMPMGMMEGMYGDPQMGYGMPNFPGGFDPSTANMQGQQGQGFQGEYQGYEQQGYQSGWQDQHGNWHPS